MIHIFNKKIYWKHTLIGQPPGDLQHLRIVARVALLPLRVAAVGEAGFGEYRLLVSVAVLAHDHVGRVVVALPQLVRLVHVHEQIGFLHGPIGEHVGRPREDIMVGIRKYSFPSKRKNPGAQTVAVKKVFRNDTAAYGADPPSGGIIDQRAERKQGR